MLQDLPPVPPPAEGRRQPDVPEVPVGQVPAAPAPEEASLLTTAVQAGGAEPRTVNLKMTSCLFVYCWCLLLVCSDLTCGQIVCFDRSLCRVLFVVFCWCSSSDQWSVVFLINRSLRRFLFILFCWCLLLVYGDLDYDQLLF